MKLENFIHAVTDPAVAKRMEQIVKNRDDEGVTQTPATRYIVVCKGGSGDYYLATRRNWVNKGKAQQYANSVNPNRFPIVVECAAGLPLHALLTE